MRIVLTRHAHVDGIDPPRFRGRTELPLSELGKRQAAMIARRLSVHERAKVIYSSPLGRCLETSEAIAKAMGASVEATPDLIDLDYGQWQARTHAEIGEAEPEGLSMWYRSPQLFRFPLGESLQDVSLRTADLLRRLLLDHSNETVVLVGHASVNRVLLLQLLDMPLASYWRLTQEPCTLNIVEWAPRRVRVITINDVSHLDELSPESERDPRAVVEP